MKTVDEIADLIERPDVLRRILQDYCGPYSLGITEREGQPALLLRVAGERPQRTMRTVSVDGDIVPLVVEAGFKPPRPL